ncbi:hypothetical protein ACH4UM_36495 [Streptomyces sp. NPDC020801]|uniref:hypothetical protein n=1 Tax=unclassified Streptomyces TaxID=2593676 RepID=UPI0037900E7F
MTATNDRAPAPDAASPPADEQRSATAGTGPGPATPHPAPAADETAAATVRLRPPSAADASVAARPDLPAEAEPGASGTAKPSQPDGAQATTVVELPSDALPGPATHEHGSADDQYSATVLASHWIQRPESDTKALTTLPTRPSPAPNPRSDRVEDTVLRFGPGVAAAVAHRTHLTLSLAPTAPTPPHRRGRLRRHALPALVVIAVLAFLAWQRPGTSVGVRDVAVSVRHPVLACDETADIVGVVTTDGRPGTFPYRWVRSDGSTSGVLRETVTRGQKQARLHLLWTFQGKGRYAARAELHLLSATHRTVGTTLAYDCR